MENEKADTSADADKKVVLKDFVLEYSLEGAGSLNIGALTLSLFGLEGGDNAGHTKRIAEAVWEDDRVIELHPGISDLTIVAQSEGAGDLGFLFLPKDDLLEFLRVEHDLKEVERNFEIGGHPGKLTITFTVGLSHNVNADINIGPSGEPRHQTQSLSTATPGNSLETPSLFNAIGHRFMQQFAATNNIDDINKACSNYDLAVQLAEPDGAGYGLYLADSAFGLFGRFRLLKEITDINQAISTMEAAVACTSEDDVDLPGRLNNCGSLFRARFEHSGDPQDLKSAILCQKRAVQSTHDEDPDLPMLINQLGDSFKMCFDAPATS
ncbi:hypothetical protein NLJ89_g7490 [Agrocybe chaxingu]|uniref:Uncharacterized protein n=1 Tax=Agrocybe chaxingu TaxID=84603 RepID=A0A9W8MV08_9AGAR|nr:hypothetical protein NLJ89_g7490 [Agrocybe chaxingu]